MERNLRNKYKQPIIELSDSDDDNCKPFSKSINKRHAVRKSETKKVEKATSNELSEIRTIQKSTRNQNTKSNKRKKEEVTKFNNKKQKLEILSSNNSFSTSVLQKQTDLIKNDIKQVVNIETKSNYSTAECIEWTDVDYICEINNISKQIAENVVKLFKEDNTIPFIARYRKNMTGFMEPDQLRILKDSFDQVKTIKSRAATIIKTIDKLGKWSPDIHSIVTSSKSLADLEHIYSLFKPTSKQSLAERARKLGLGDISNAILKGQNILSLTSLINKKIEGLQSEEQVKDGILHIIADVLSKNKKVIDRIISLRKTLTIEIQTAQMTRNTKHKSENTDERKYEMYFNFKTSERNIKSHQILAINRAESQKILTVKIIVPDAFEQAFKKDCLYQYKLAARTTKFHLDLLNNSIEYAYKKLIKPLIIRRVRTEMKEKAEIASIEVFATNVKQLLLSAPVRGKIILGIDPGFSHGCKIAIVSEHGDVLETAVIYPHNSPKKSYELSVNVLIKLINKYKCTVLALGNGTACRETELFLTKMMQENAFYPLDVSYTIVDETGASIYSCSSEAKSEFPNLDPNLVSAVSIARRLQDPLAELVKIEPKHLGVGMYQHDLPEKHLLKTLDEVVTEAVSFVGIDINTASKCLLRRVAGLTNTKAANIIEWRIKHGAFQNRKQLLSVKGIGDKTYEQCVGFIRIMPATAMIHTKYKESKNIKDNFNLLDQTWIHPESYAIANQFLQYCQISDLCNLGTTAFIDKINYFAKKGYTKLATQFDTNEATIEIIVKGLAMKTDEDIRLKSNYPLFRNNMLNINDLNIGTILSGAVRNVTHFGVFVDVGVGRNGLIHNTYMNNETLHIGQRVEVKVISVEPIRNRIGLKLIKTL